MTTTSMASAILTPSCRSQTSSSSLSKIVLKTPTPCNFIYTSQIQYPKTPIPRSLTWVPQLGLAPFSPWNGLIQNGFTISQPSFRLERRRKCKGKGRRNGVFASLFGVGAPEALVIGVVALLVFGPKGLAEVARNLGKTLRAFQPTIRELQEVSREFKSTLEKEIGLDELKNPAQGNYTANALNQYSSTAPVANPENPLATSTTPTVTQEGSQETAPAYAAAPENSQSMAPAATLEDAQPIVDPPNGSASQSKAYSSEDLLKITEEQLKALQQKEQTTDKPLTPSQDDIQDVAAGTPPAEKPKTEN